MNQKIKFCVYFLYKTQPLQQITVQHTYKSWGRILLTYIKEIKSFFSFFNVKEKFTQVRHEKFSFHTKKNQKISYRLSVWAQPWKHLKYNWSLLSWYGGLLGARRWPRKQSYPLGILDRFKLECFRFSTKIEYAVFRSQKRRQKLHDEFELNLTYSHWLDQTDLFVIVVINHHVWYFISQHASVERT